MDTTILASILGGLVSGLFTFLGVLITIRYCSKKDAIEEERRIKAGNQAIEKEKPRFEIVGYNEISKYDERSDDADISVFFAGIQGYDKASRRFSYNEGLVDKNNWVCIKKAPVKGAFLVPLTRACAFAQSSSNTNPARTGENAQKRAYFAGLQFKPLKRHKTGIPLYGYACFGAADRARTGTKFYFRGILSPLRLPVSPQRHMELIAGSADRPRNRGMRTLSWGRAYGFCRWAAVCAADGTRAVLSAAADRYERFPVAIGTGSHARCRQRRRGARLSDISEHVME